MAHRPSYQQKFNSAREEDQVRGAGGDGGEVFGSGAWDALGSIYSYQRPALDLWDQNPNQLQETVDSSKQPARAPTMTVQKKGEASKNKIPISNIFSWEDLLKNIRHLYLDQAFSVPTITTYEGDLLSPNNFTRYMKQNQHLVLSFPSDHRVQTETLRSLIDTVSPPSQAPNRPSNSTGTYSSNSSTRSELEQRHQKLAQDNQSVKALAEHVRKMAEQTLRQCEEEGVEVVPASANYMSPRIGGQTPSISQYSSPPSSYHYKSPSPMMGTPIQMAQNKSAQSAENQSRDERDWTFARDPSVWYPASDQWSSSRGMEELDKLGVSPVDVGNYRNNNREQLLKDAVSPTPTIQTLPSSQPTPRVESEDLPDYSDVDGLAWSFFKEVPDQKAAVKRMVQASNAAHNLTLDDLSLDKLLVKKRQADDDPSYDDKEKLSPSPFEPQSDHIESEEAQTVLLCPHITFHTLKPMNIRVNVTPTVTVIPPSAPQDHERFFVTTVGEKLDIDLSLKNNGKITEVVTHPEGDAQLEPITLLKKSQGKGAGGRWHISRMDTQLEGGWGKAEVGELGAHSADGKKMNGGEMVDFAYRGEENSKRTFALAFDKLEEFLELFMETCGFPKRERDTMKTFWCSRLPTKASEKYFLLVKVIPVKVMASLLPISVSPTPDRIVRFFLQMRIASKETIEKDKLEVAGMMSSVVHEVLDSKPRPLVPALKSGRGRGRGRGGSKSIGRGGIQNQIAERKQHSVVLQETPKSGLTVFEYGGILMADHDMRECLRNLDAPKEDCANQLLQPPQAIKHAPQQPDKQPSVSEDVSDDSDVEDEMDVDMYISDPESVQHSVFSDNSNQSHTTNNTTPSSIHNDAYMADYAQQPYEALHTPSLPSTYWTGYKFPSDQQNFNFGEYVPSNYNTFSDQALSPMDHGQMKNSSIDNNTSYRWHEAQQQQRFNQHYTG